MINISPHTNRRKLGLFSWLCILVIGCVNTQKSIGAKMENANNLWAVVDAISNLEPLTKSGVEMALATPLQDRQDLANLDYRFYEASAVALSNGIMLSKVDLRINRLKPGVGFLVINVDGKCIKLEEVREKFDGLKITDTPRGKSLDEVIALSALQKWGRLTFAFKIRNPDCLAYIAFDPKNR